ncbi:MAG: hypothetical protein IIC80_13505, partial [Chloroflexi bacterium]|nr:hypothetical protein [Chloroflexota bacterium]
ADGGIVSRVAQAPPGEGLVIEVSDGRLTADVTGPGAPSRDGKRGRSRKTATAPEQVRLL